MALKNTLDAGTVAARLESWLPDALAVEGPVEVSDVVIPTASGMSSETVLFNATWAGGSRGLVVRVPPEVGLFPEYDLAREARTMSALAKHSTAPVPAVVAHEQADSVLGAQFLLLERAYGRVPGDDPPFVTGGWVTELSERERSTMYDSALRALAAVQAVDPGAIGLGDLHQPDPITYWRGFYAWAGADRTSPLIDAALDILANDAPDGYDAADVVSWGDARFGNLMFGDDHEVTAVLDWEMATLARREVDLGYWLFFDRLYTTGIGAPRLSGFPERSQAIARFEELTGSAVHNIDWFEAWAALRGAILLFRVGTLMIEHGQLPADAPLPINNPAAHVLAGLLDLEVPEGAAQWITGNR